MKWNAPFWSRVLLVNLLIVATLGVVMRYKIAFAFPHFQQKFLQEAHSHFAFAGWITQCIYFFIIRLFRSNLDTIAEKTYARLMIANLVSAYGMLVSFAVQGYGPVSVFFASGSLLTGYIFSWQATRDTRRLDKNHPSRPWILAAILFGVLSSLGTIILSHMMITHDYDQTLYLGSIYFYLHFQYNGWFMFACFAIFLDRVKEFLPAGESRRIFWLFFLAGIPAYFLSTLWAHIPQWLYLLVVLAAFAQVTGWGLFIRMIRKQADTVLPLFQGITRYLLLAIALALSVKLLLQLGSTLPLVSKLAFGFRPIVMAYLHLVLLLIMSGFLLTFLYATRVLQVTRLTTAALLVFFCGAILNECVLATEGIASFSYTVIPRINEILFGVALILFAGAFMMVLSQFRTGRS